MVDILAVDLLLDGGNGLVGKLLVLEHCDKFVSDTASVCWEVGGCLQKASSSRVRP